MHKVEIYELKHNGQKLIFDVNNDMELKDFIMTWDGLGNGLKCGKKSYVLQYALGHEENILCKVFKLDAGQGGLIAVYDKNVLLLVGYAMDNLAYVEAIAHYSKMATYTRYGYDVFMD